MDNQLPVALAKRLAGLGHDAQHVLDVGLGSASDTAIGQYASAHARVLITKDEDFLSLIAAPEATLHVVWVRLGNCRNATLLATFESVLPRLQAAFQAGDRIVEIRGS